MTENHPITPTLKLFRKWTEYRGTETEDQFWWHIATQAAQWGADQELEACCEWLGQKVLLQHQSDVVPALRSARRPKPPSLKEQALEAQQRLMTGAWRAEDWQFISRALEQLPE
jgi:hypothetical protein